MHPQLGNLSSRTNKKGKKFCSVGWINNENWGLNSRAELCHSLLICLWETLFKPERPQANILPYLSLYFCPSPASLFYTSLASSITSCLLWNLIHIKVKRSWYWRMVSGISRVDSEGTGSSKDLEAVPPVDTVLRQMHRGGSAGSPPNAHCTTWLLFWVPSLGLDRVALKLRLTTEVRAETPMDMHFGTALLPSDCSLFIFTTEKV